MTPRTVFHQTIARVLLAGGLLVLALAAVVWFGTWHCSLARIARGLGDSDPEVRHRAVIFLNAGGSAAVPYLLDAMQGGDMNTRLAALDACGLHDSEVTRGFTIEDDSRLLPVVLRCSQDSDPVIRGAAYYALVSVCLGAQEQAIGTEALRKGLEDQDIGVRRECARAIDLFSRLRKADQKLLAGCVRALRGNIRDEDRELRRRVVRALGRQHQLPDDALRDLVESLAFDPDEVVRRTVRQDLRIRHPEEFADEAQVRRLARWLEDAFQSKDRKPFRQDVIDVYVCTVPLKDEPMTFLLDAATDSSEVVRMLAAGALGQKGPEAIAAVPILHANLQSAGPEGKAAIASALWRITDEQGEAMVVIAELLSSTIPEVRLQGIRAIIEVGPAAAPAMPMLRAIVAADRDPEVAREARDALSMLSKR